MHRRIPATGLILTLAAGLLLTACSRSPGSSPAPGRLPAPGPKLESAPISLQPASPPLPDGSYLIEPDTGQVWLLSSDPFARVTWTKDAATLLVSHEPSHNRHEAIVIDVATMKGTRLHGPGELNLHGTSISPDGKQIGFTNPQAGLQVANRDGTNPRSLGIAKPTGAVKWSPDGARLAVTGTGQEMVQVHVVSDLASGKSSLVGEARWSWYDWAPDSKRLALAQMDRVIIQGLDPADRVEILMATGPLFWSRDGAWLASSVENFGPNAVGSTLMVKQVGAPGGPEQFADTLRFVDWAPDSRQIAYITNGCGSGRFDLVALRVDTGEARRLTDSPGLMKHQPKWSPAGGTIAYATAQDLRLVDVATGQERVLLSLGRQPKLKGWSPDGRYLAIGFWQYGVTGCKEE